NTHSNGMSLGTSASWDLPFTLSWVIWISPWGVPCGSRSKLVDVDDRLGECLRRFLRQVVADAAFQIPMRIPAGKFLRIGARIRVRGAIGVAFESDGRHGYHREFGQPLFQGIELRFAFLQGQPPAIVVD